MKKTKLGRTGIEISKLGLGGLFAAGKNDNLETGKDILRCAYEAGINYVDTAPSYGKSEMVLGKLFSEVGQPEILSTKIGGKPEPFEPQNKDCLMKSVENSLKLLGRDSIDMLMIHEPDGRNFGIGGPDYLHAEGTIDRSLSRMAYTGPDSDSRFLSASIRIHGSGAII